MLRRRYLSKLLPVFPLHGVVQAVSYFLPYQGLFQTATIGNNVILAADKGFFVILPLLKVLEKCTLSHEAGGRLSLLSAY